MKVLFPKLVIGSYSHGVQLNVKLSLSTRSNAAVKSIQSTDAIFVGKKLSFNTDLSFPFPTNKLASLVLR